MIVFRDRGICSGNERGPPDSRRSNRRSTRSRGPCRGAWSARSEIRASDDTCDPDEAGTVVGTCYEKEARLDRTPLAHISTLHTYSSSRHGCSISFICVRSSLKFVDRARRHTEELSKNPVSRVIDGICFFVWIFCSWTGDLF